jgi:hypothetical protein
MESSNPACTARTTSRRWGWPCNIGGSACDARYLIVARDLGAKLVTEDAKLLSAAPKLTQSLADAVGY